MRLAENDPKGYPDGLWKQLSESGLIGILIPEEFGGGGLTMIEAALLYEELGRAMAPTPHFVSGVLAARILLRAAGDAEKQE